MIFDIVLDFISFILEYFSTMVLGFLPNIPNMSNSDFFGINPEHIGFVISVMFEHVGYFVPVKLVLTLIAFNVALYSFNVFYAVFLKIKSFIPFIY